MSKFYLLILTVFMSSIIEAQNFKFGKVSIEELEETEHPLNKEVDAVVLYRSQKTSYEFSDKLGFTVVTQVHERIKIYNKNGFDWATKEISYYKNNQDRESISNLKGYTYNLIDGKVKEDKLRKNGIFEEETSFFKLKTKFTMPSITEGCVIEYSYELRSPFITSIDYSPLQYTIPINKLEVEFKIPEYFGFKYHFNPRSPLMFSVKTEKDLKSHTFTKQVRSTGSGWHVVQTTARTTKLEYSENLYSIYTQDVPALNKEEFVDYINNYAAFIMWELIYTKFPNSLYENYAGTWEEVAKNIYKDAGLEKELNSTGFFEKDIDDLLSGVGGNSAKAETIYNFVRNKVKWNNYLGFISEHGVKKAYKEERGNIGDINLILTSMLNYAGITAEPVLVSTVDNGIPLFPTRTGYNYLIVAAHLNGEIVLLDGSDPNLGFGEIPYRARNWQGRLIRKDGSSDWVNLMPRYKAQNLGTVNFKFNEDLSLAGKSVKVYSGLEAKSYRDNFSPLNIEEYIKILEKDKGNIVISDLKKQNEELIGEEIKEAFSFELKNAVDRINEKIYFQPLLFTALKENPFKSSKREHPIFFNFPKIESNTINILIPNGYEVEFLPEPKILNFKDGALIYKYLPSQNGNFLRIESQFDMTQTVFTPQDYQNLKEFYSMMLEKQSETIVLKKI